MEVMAYSVKFSEDQKEELKKCAESIKEVKVESRIPFEEINRLFEKEFK